MNVRNPNDAREAARKIVADSENNRAETRSLFESMMKELEKAAPGDISDETLGMLLNLPDENFALIAPAFLDELEKSLNNVNDKLGLAESLNAAGMKLEDVGEQFREIAAQLDEATAGLLSVQKRDFLKRLLSITYNAIAETTGIAKRVIQVPIEYCSQDAKMPAYAHESDAGMDVYALEDITIEPGETKLIPIGIKVALPLGYELQVRPKSGRCLKTKLRVANAPGTIDAGYRDEIGVIIDNIDPPIRKITPREDGSIDESCIEYGQSYTIGKGEKFAQLVLNEVPKTLFFEVESVADYQGNRGGGFGSTGIK